MTKKSRRVAKARRVLFSLSLVLVTMVVAVGGTIAWLTDKTDTITNTFTASGIDIDLFETRAPESGLLEENEAWEAQLIPGKTYHKDPQVVVYRDRTENGVALKGTDVDIYLFVEFDNQAPAALTFTSNLEGNGWTAGTGDPDYDEAGNVVTEGNGVPVGVYYRIVGKDEYDEGDTTKKTFKLIADDTVSIASTVTKDQTATGGTMTYTAYAIQKTGNNGVDFTPAQAWLEVPKQ